MVTILNYTTVLWSQLQVRSQVVTGQAAWDRLCVPSQRTETLRHLILRWQRTNLDGDGTTIELMVYPVVRERGWLDMTNLQCKERRSSYHKWAPQTDVACPHVRGHSSAKTPSSCHWQTTLGLTYRFAAQTNMLQIKSPAKEDIFIELVLNIRTYIFPGQHYLFSFQNIVFWEFDLIESLPPCLSAMQLRCVNSGNGPECLIISCCNMK